MILTTISVLRSFDERAEAILWPIDPFLLLDFSGEEDNGLISRGFGTEI